MWPNIIKYTSLSFAIQACAWMIMSMLTIIVIEEELYPDTISTYSDFLSTNIYIRFFMKGTDLKLTNNYRPHVKWETFPQMTYLVESESFESFAIVQCILNATWFVMSILIYNWISKNKLNPSRSSAIRIWLAIGIAVTIVDFVLTVNLLVDLFETLNAFENHIRYRMDIMVDITTTGVVITIVARGFILWAANAVLLLILYRKLWRLTTQDMDWLSPNSNPTNIGITNMAPVYQMYSMPGGQQNQQIYPMVTSHYPNMTQSPPNY